MVSHGVQYMLRTLDATHVAGGRPMLLDVGANIGMYSLAAAAAGHETFAFEPEERPGPRHHSLGCPSLL